MTERRGRELTDSFELLAAEERWLPTDLVVGAIALVVWVAGTGALATQVASAAGIPLGIEAGETPSVAAVGLFVGLWLVVPAAAFVVRVRQRTLNLRGNVEQYYRFDHPAALLAPPAVLVIGLVGTTLALGRVPWYFTLLVVPVGLFTLVRTLAFSYRVYGFSHPLLVQAGTLVATGVALAGAAGAVATATGQGPLIRQALWAVGLSGSLIGSVTVGPLAVTWPSVAVLAPFVVAVAYVLLQTVVALGVRLVKPDIDRSRMRTGQRYPPFLEATTPVQSPAASGDDASSSPTATESGAGNSSTEADAAPTSGAASDDGEVADDEDAEDLDDVSNTRVFTPPADGGDDALGAGTTASGTDADSRARSDGVNQTRAVPGTDDTKHSGDDGSREHCDACGESFTVDTAVRFCPNCGAALEGE